jgi:hypothetical protein
MITGVQPKLLVSFDDEGNLQLDPWQAEVVGLIESNCNWKLVRERDGLTKQSEQVMWIEFNNDGRFKEKYDEIGLNRSLIMSPFNDFFTWQTTTVNEILEQTDEYVKFKTNNSIYTLSKLNGDGSKK